MHLAYYSFDITRSAFASSLTCDSSVVCYSAFASLRRTQGKHNWVESRNIFRYVASRGGGKSRSSSLGGSAYHRVLGEQDQRDEKEEAYIRRRRQTRPVKRSKNFLSSWHSFCFSTAISVSSTFGIHTTYIHTYTHTYILPTEHEESLVYLGSCTTEKNRLRPVYIQSSGRLHSTFWRRDGRTICLFSPVLIVSWVLSFAYSSSVDQCL